MKDRKLENKKRQKTGEYGFSILELVIVVLVMAILAVMVVGFGHQKLHYADRQANLVMDFMREARQRAITQQETMRVEINLDHRHIRLISENEPGDSEDDQVLKAVALGDAQYIVFDKMPANMDAGPVEPTPVPPLKFKPSVYDVREKKGDPIIPPTTKQFALAMAKAAEDDDDDDGDGGKSTESLRDMVATLRFLRNGNVVDAGYNATGDGSMVTGATIYFWMPEPKDDGSVSANAGVLRALTVLGNSATTRYWKCPIVEGRCSEWRK